MADAVADQKLDFDRLADDLLEGGLAKLLGDKIAEILAKMFEDEPPSLGLSHDDNGLILTMWLPALDGGFNTMWSAPLRTELEEYLEGFRPGGDGEIVDDGKDEDGDIAGLRRMIAGLRAEADWMESQIIKK